jgi:Arc/MetJ-type ribon-helix-helix transcriptional regulator
MGSAKVSIRIEGNLLTWVDRWVAAGRYRNRSQAICSAIREKAQRSRKRRLAAQAARLDPKEERALAEEGL